MARATLLGWHGIPVEVEIHRCDQCGGQELLYDKPGAPIWMGAHVETFFMFPDGRRYCEDCRSTWTNRWAYMEARLFSDVADSTEGLAEAVGKVIAAELVRHAADVQAYVREQLVVDSIDLDDMELDTEGPGE